MDALTNLPNDTFEAVVAGLDRRGHPRIYVRCTRQLDADRRCKRLGLWVGQVGWPNRLPWLCWQHRQAEETFARWMRIRRGDTKAAQVLATALGFEIGPFSRWVAQRSQAITSQEFAAADEAYRAFDARSKVVP